MREGRSLARGYRRILVPSFVAALLPFALVWLPNNGWRLGPLIAAGALTLVIAGVAFHAPWPRLPGWAPCLPAFAYLLVFALLRGAGGPSGVAPVMLLPVFWIALLGTPRQLACLLVVMTSVLFVPLLVVGGPTYPPTAWRASVLFVAVSAIIGATIQSLVTYVGEQARERNRLLARLEELAHTDALTGLANRRAWESELARGLARAQRSGEPVSVAVIDIDNFKAVNDARGHGGGDALLIQVAQRWSEAIRPDDVLARVGGDEFAVLMPACTAVEAAYLIGRLRARMPSPDTCSVGVATWDGAELPDRLVLRADAALYEAKREGRDRVSSGLSW
jgi:diguanylate cyclase (GGDEF)-like protein